MAIRNLEKEGLVASELSLDGSKEVAAVASEGWEAPASQFGGSKAESCTVEVNGKRLERYGSEKRVEEWKRSLACKLYEERWSVGKKGEGMDLLWEDSCRVDDDEDMKKATKQRSVSRKDDKGVAAAAEEECECQAEEIAGKVWCLRTVKSSAGGRRLGARKTAKLAAKLTMALMAGVGLVRNQSSNKKARRV